VDGEVHNQFGDDRLAEQKLEGWQAILWLAKVQRVCAEALNNPAERGNKLPTLPGLRLDEILLLQRILDLLG
jgi:hypothetical protein